MMQCDCGGELVDTQEDYTWKYVYICSKCKIVIEQYIGNKPTQYTLYYDETNPYNTELEEYWFYGY